MWGRLSALFCKVNFKLSLRKKSLFQTWKHMLFVSSKKQKVVRFWRQKLFVSVKRSYCLNCDFEWRHFHHIRFLFLFPVQLTEGYYLFKFPANNTRTSSPAGRHHPQRRRHPPDVHYRWKQIPAGHHLIQTNYPDAETRTPLSKHICSRQFSSGTLIPTSKHFVPSFLWHRKNTSRNFCNGISRWGFTVSCNFLKHTAGTAHK